MKALYKSIGTVLMMAVLAGCAGDVVMMKPLTPKSKLTNEQGVVVATVVDTSGYPLPFNQLTFTPENVNESKKIKPIRLMSEKGARTGTTIFAAPVAAGSYAVSSIRSFYSRGDYWYSKFASTDVTMGTFTVEPGKVTDLGTLVYYAKPDGDRYKDVLVRVPDYQNELGKVVKEKYAFFEFDENNVLTWNEDERDDERSATFASIAQNPVAFGERYLAPNGKLYFLSQLGVILSLDESGEFELSAIDTNNALTNMAQNTQGINVVADSMGNLYQQGFDEEWQTLDLDIGSRVHKLLFADDENLNILSSKGTSLFVNNFNVLTGEFTELNKYSRSKGWQTATGAEKEQQAHNSKKKVVRNRVVTYADLYEVSGKHYVSIQQIGTQAQLAFGGGDLTVYEYDPTDWSVNRYPSEVSIHATLNAGSKTLGIERAGFWSWSGRPTYYVFSKDEEPREIKAKAFACAKGEMTAKYDCKVKPKNKKNTKIVRNSGKSFNFTSAPIFLDDQNAIAIARVSGKEFNLEDDNVPQVIKTVDGGQHWTVTGNTTPKNYCSILIPQIKGKLVLTCNGATGDFYESTDEGETWEHIRQHENF